MMTKITVIEGTNFKQLLAQLAADERIKHSLQDKTPQEVLQILELTETHPEELRQKAAEQEDLHLQNAEKLRLEK